MTQHDPPAVFAADASTVDLPMQTRLDVRLMAESAVAETRTIEVVWSTGAAVRRRDPWSGKAYEEVLSLDPAHVDLTRLNGGAPLLNTHGAFDLEDVIGVVERAWIAREGGTYVGRATVRFSDRADVEPIWQDVKGGIIRNVSVGYSVRTYEIREEEGAVPIWTAIDWQPLELSAVPVGADGAAGFRSNTAPTPCRLLRQGKPTDPTHEEDTPMTDTTVESAAEAQNESAPQDANAIVTPMPEVERQEQRQMPAPASEQRRGDSQPDVKPERILAEERARVTGIYDAARKLNVDQALADDLVKRGIVIGEARAALIDAAAARDAAIETRPHIRMGGQDEVETRRAAVETALLHRFEPGRFKLTDAARDWRGLSLIEMARSFLESEGVQGEGPGARRDCHARPSFDLRLPADPGRCHQPDTPGGL